MPYKKKKKTSTFYRRKKNYVTRSQVNQMIAARQETKFRVLSWNADSVQDSGRTPITADWCQVGQGHGQSAREGDQILVTGYYGKFQIAGADTTNIVRMIIYISKENTTMSGVSTYDLVDLDKYTILEDKIVTLSQNGEFIKSFTLGKKFNRGAKKGMTVQFDGNTGADVVKNDIKMYVVSDSLAVSDPTFSGNVRLYFKDG